MDYITDWLRHKKFKMLSKLDSIGDIDTNFDTIQWRLIFYPKWNSG